MYLTQYLQQRGRSKQAVRHHEDITRNVQSATRSKVIRLICSLWTSIRTFLGYREGVKGNTSDDTCTAMRRKPFAWCACLAFFAIMMVLIVLWVIQWNQTNGTKPMEPIQFKDCIKVLSYDNHPGSAGIDHQANCLLYRVFDAVLHGYTHLITLSLAGHLNAMHLSNEQRDTNAVNVSWWHYYDVDQFANEYNITILMADEDSTKIWLHGLNITKNKTRQTNANELCEDSHQTDCNTMTIRHNEPGWAPWYQCFDDDFHRHKRISQRYYLLNPSPFVESCATEVSQFVQSQASSSQCFVAGMLRLGDRKHQYQDEFRELLVPQNVAAMFLYLAEQHCPEGAASVAAMYIASNGDQEFLDKVTRYVHAFNPKAQMFNQLSVLQQEDTTISGKCSREMRTNNYFLYSVEKAIYPKATVHFHVNPKFEDWVHDLGFTAFTQNDDAFDVTVQAVLQFASKMRT